MTRKLSLTIECPDWCDESPVKHLDDGAIYHRHTIGKVTGSGGASAVDDPELTTTMEVTLERYDTIDEDGLHLGTACIRLGSDEVYEATAARDLAKMLAEIGDVLDGTVQVMAEQDAVADDGGHA